MSNTAGAVHFCITRYGFEFSVRGLDAREAVSRCRKVYDELTNLAAGRPPERSTRTPEPGRPFVADDTIVGSVGYAHPYNPELAEAAGQYGIKIEVVLNSKGFGYEVTVKSTGDTESAYAAYTQVCDLMSAAFPELTEGAGSS